MECISTNDIVSCSGADSYAEILLNGGREILHGATLAEMEKTLPATFPGVHRPRLVNTDRVRSLRRDTSGTGALILVDGSEIPVSRRIMPQVQQALG